jgi:17beta-estradiol 17-dehydrogenase / very-long-chain 3-oxoacyl-CoA reductase
MNFVFQSLLATYKMYLRPGKNLKKLGEWCVVTGATDGIGKEYAFALAKRGLNVVLISRTESKLQDVAKEIKDRYSGVHIKYIVCDYSNFDKKARDAVYKAIQGLDIGVLVNNVGISYRYPVYFHELDDEAVHHLVEMNVNSTVYMTRMVLPGMLERKRGAIINISSGSSQITLPLLAEYGAAKSFIEKFSRALNAEYSSKGVTCQCQIPFYVATKLAKMRKSLIVPTPKEYVASAIRYVGYPDAVVAPILLHAIQGWMFDVLPDFVVSHLVMSRHMGIRKRGQKKDAKLATEGGKKAE